MDAKLVQVLLRCVQTAQARFPLGAVLREFHHAYRIGLVDGRSIYFDESEKMRIRQILASEEIRPDTRPDAWQGLSRAEALTIGNNEKYTHEPVRRRRVAIKALRPEQPLVIRGRPLYLPAGCHVDADYLELDGLPAHDFIIVVENWECFGNIEVAAQRLRFPGTAPVVVWRGAKDGSRPDMMLEMLARSSQPVAAFVDFDPAGLVIALSLPRLSALVSPDLEELAILLKRGLADRYMAQIAGCQRTLNECTNPIVSRVWQVIRNSGRALPQEWFVVPEVDRRATSGSGAAQQEIGNG